MTDDPKSRADRQRAIVDRYFAAIAARDPQRIALAFADHGEIEDPVGTPVRQGRQAVAAMFAGGVASLATHVEIHVVAALPSGDSIAVHWTMTAQGKKGREIRTEGIDVLQLDDDGLIRRAEGYWDAAAFRQALAES